MKRSRPPVELDARKSMTPARRKRVLERHDHVCARLDCEEREGLEIDHIIPLALGGKDEDENLEPLCRHHHRIKTIRDVKMIARAKALEKQNYGPKQEPKIKSGKPNWPKGRKIPSRPFERGGK